MQTFKTITMNQEELQLRPFIVEQSYPAISAHESSVRHGNDRANFFF